VIRGEVGWRLQGWRSGGERPCADRTGVRAARAARRALESSPRDSPAPTARENREAPTGEGQQMTRWRGTKQRTAKPVLAMPATISLRFPLHPWLNCPARHWSEPHTTAAQLTQATGSVLISCLPFRSRLVTHGGVDPGGTRPALTPSPPYGLGVVGRCSFSVTRGWRGSPFGNRLDEIRTCARRKVKHHQLGGGFRNRPIASIPHWDCEKGRVLAERPRVTSVPEPAPMNGTLGFRN
jgi:hypothetical protein